MSKTLLPVLKIVRPQTRPKPPPRSEVPPPRGAAFGRPVASSPMQRHKRAALRSQPTGTITAKKAAETEGELLLFGSIGEDFWGEGITGQSFDEALKSLGSVDTVRLRINSGGGDVFEATAIYNMIVNHPAYFIGQVEGVAASAATLVLQGTDERRIAANAHFMVHAASGIAWGNAQQLRQYLQLLDNADDLIRLTYSARSGIPVAELVPLMDHDHWMKPSEALELGFVDALDEAKTVKPHVVPEEAETDNLAQRHPGAIEPERLAAMASNLHSLAACIRPATSPHSLRASAPALQTPKEEAMKLTAKLRAKCAAAGMSDKLSDDEAAAWFAQHEDAVLAAPEPPAPSVDSKALNADAILSVIEARERKRLEARKAWRIEVEANLALAFGDQVPADLRTACYDLEEEGINALRAKIQDSKKQADEQTNLGCSINVKSVQPSDQHLAAIRSGLLVRTLGNFQHLKDVKLSPTEVLEKHLPAKDRAKGWEDFSRMHLRDVARECLLASGIRYEDVRRLTGPQVAMAALGFHTQAGLRNSAALHTTGSLAEITRDAVNKSLFVGYEEAPQTWRGPFRQGTSAQDFKDIHRVKLGAVGNLPIWNDNMAPEEAKLANEKEKYAVEARALDLSFSWQLVINDDMDAISRRPQLVGDSCGRTVNAVAWRQLTANPTMADGQPLFLETPAGNRKRKNFTTGSATPTNTTIGAMKALMRVMRGLNTPEGAESDDILNLEPAFLIGPAALEELILKQVFSGADPASGANSAVFNTSRTLTPIIEPLLDADSTSAFYLSASPNRVDTVEVTFLEGQETPVAYEYMDNKTMAQHFTIIQTFQAKALDHRGFQKHKGAA